MLATGRRAFGKKSFEQFNQLYEELRRKWQVFRGTHGDHWSAEKTYDHFQALDGRYGRKRLSECLLDDSGGIWRLLEGSADIKLNKNGPSIVAMSKFLHFWNPRLFVIVDSGVIWGLVLSHWWLRDEIEKVRAAVKAQSPGRGTETSGKVCDPLTYLSILLWAAELLVTIRKYPPVSRNT